MRIPRAAVLASAFVASTSAFAPARYAGSSVARSTANSFIGGLALQSRSKSTSAVQMSMSATSAADMVKNEIDSNDVVVFSKTYCPFCTATKGLMQDLSIDAKVIELDEVPMGSEMQAALLEISGQRTVPNVFIKGKHLGGNDDTQAAARSGKLQEMLKA